MLLPTSRGLAPIASGAAVAGIILPTGFSLFPFPMPSSTPPRTRPDHVGRGIASESTPGTMLLVTAVLLPIVLAYTTRAFRVMRGQTTRQHVIDPEDVY